MPDLTNRRRRASRVLMALTALSLPAAPVMAFIADAIPLGRPTQDAPSPATNATFEVASVKRTPPDRPIPPPEIQELLIALERTQRGRIRMPGVSLRLLIQRGYNVKRLQIVDGPAWVGSERYDVEALAREGASFDEKRSMLRAMLEERFKLSLRREMRTLPIFELVPSRRGLKIAAMKEADCVTLGPGSPPPRIALPPAPMPNICGWIRRVILNNPESGIVERIEAAGVGMPELIGALSADVDRVIVDRTGFNDRFSFRLDFASSLSASSNTAGVSDLGTALSLFGALEEQLGLQLRRARGSVEVLAISHVERPSEN